MSKKQWIWIVCGTLFPPLLFIPLIYYYIYLPYKEGVIRGSRISFYFWASSIMAISALSALPLKNLTKNFFQLNQISTTQNFIIASFVLALLTIFMIFRSTRNEPDQNEFLGIHKFKIDKLFIICLLITFIPYTLILMKNVSLDYIAHPFSYAIAIAFINKNYFLVFLGFLTISILTAIMEECVFRGFFLRDYLKLKPLSQKLLLALTAIYFGAVHLPLYFVGPFVFALFLNRIRLAYKNILPTILLHALWNANITIALLVALDSTSTPKSSSIEEEIVKSSVMWQYKEMSLGEKYFELEKPKDDKEIKTFKGRYLTIITLPQSTDSKLIQSMIVISKQPVPRFTVEYGSPAIDWETRVLKKLNPGNKEIEQTFRCTKKLDICFKVTDEATRAIVHGHYDNPDIF